MTFGRRDERLQVCAPLTDIRDTPAGYRKRQLIYGDIVTVEDRTEGWCIVRAEKDGYRGVVHPDDLAEPVTPTHSVVALATHLYTAADPKSPDIASLTFGAQLCIEREVAGFGRTHDGGFVPMVHVADVRRRFADPAAVAELFLGTPYLWGGNTRLGLDCSGLVQAACLACNLACPGDSADQAREAGEPVDDAEPLARGDLIFWQGHVAMAVDDNRLIHATAHHMAVVFEEAEAAVRRIAAKGEGPVTARRRLRPQ
jgi:cell wall-associated NlpC family hydrolase